MDSVCLTLSLCVCTRATGLAFSGNFVLYLLIPLQKCPIFFMQKLDNGGKLPSQQNATSPPHPIYSDICTSSPLPSGPPPTLSLPLHSFSSCYQRGNYSMPLSALTHVDSPAASGTSTPAQSQGASWGSLQNLPCSPKVPFLSISWFQGFAIFLLLGSIWGHAGGENPPTVSMGEMQCHFLYISNYEPIHISYKYTSTVL